jgi:alpha-ketoglutarate-dependent taurine dioxygenase
MWKQPPTHTTHARRYMALETLPAELRERVRGLRATHVYTNRRDKDPDGRPIGMTDAQVAAVEEVVSGCACV